MPRVWSSRYQTPIASRMIRRRSRGRSTRALRGGRQSTHARAGWGQGFGHGSTSRWIVIVSVPLESRATGGHSREQGGTSVVDLAESWRVRRIRATPLLDGCPRDQGRHALRAPSDSFLFGEGGSARVAFLQRAWSPPPGATHSAPQISTTGPTSGDALARRQALSRRAPPARSSYAVKPGDFVVCDQFVDRTSVRPQTFYDGRLSLTSPRRDIRPGAAADRGRVSAADGSRSTTGGTVVRDRGPALLAKANSKWFSDAGWDWSHQHDPVPEAGSAASRDGGSETIALITDYDAASTRARRPPTPVRARVFAHNAERIQKVVLDMLPGSRADLDKLGVLLPRVHSW